MRRSWWELGEGSGHLGKDLALHKITCAFCQERGNFKLAFHEEKKKPNSEKKLNFDVYKCVSCAGFVHVLWSAEGWNGGLHAFEVLPWPLRTKPEPPEHWPAEISRFWVQAHDTAASENWDAAAVMARSALQQAVRSQGASGGNRNNLQTEIDDLSNRGILPPHMKEWAHELRLLANDSAHPSGSTTESSQQDVSDILEFLDFLLVYLYNLPHDISEYRKRRASSAR